MILRNNYSEVWDTLQTHIPPYLNVFKIKNSENKVTLFGCLPLCFQILAVFLNQIAAEICAQLPCHLGQKNTALKLSYLQLGKQLENSMECRDKDQKTGGIEKSVSFRDLWTTVGENRYLIILSIWSPQLAKKPKELNVLAEFSLSLRLKWQDNGEPPHDLAGSWQTVYLCFSLSAILHSLGYSNNQTWAPLS